MNSDQSVVASIAAAPVSAHAVKMMVWPVLEALRGPGIRHKSSRDGRRALLDLEKPFTAAVSAHNDAVILVAPAGMLRRDNLLSRHFPQGTVLSRRYSTRNLPGSPRATSAPARPEPAPMWSRLVRGSLDGSSFVIIYRHKRKDTLSFEICGSRSFVSLPDPGIALLGMPQM
jgi:hypothetical protein